MKIEKLAIEQQKNMSIYRPNSFEDFIGQETTKKIISTAIDSAQKSDHTLGHMLLAGPSGYGKTTLANIISQTLGTDIKIITAYAISKPSEMLSILHSLKKGDILFIDEIHRLKPIIEEILYIAMEDFSVDMVMPEGGNIRIQIESFTLIGATTKIHNLSTPLKNRFVYKFHLTEYTTDEVQYIIEKYLNQYDITFSHEVISLCQKKVESTPREINNFCIKIRDFCISDNNNKNLTQDRFEKFIKRLEIEDGGLHHIHKKYLALIKQSDRPVGVKTLALKLGIDEKSLEDDIEPLLLKLGKIDKTSKGRIFLSD